MADIPVSEGDSVARGFESDEDDSFYKTADERDEEYYTNMSEDVEKNEAGMTGAAGGNKQSSDSILEEMHDSNKPSDTYLYGSKGVRVLGLPLFYSPLDDVNQRVYKETFENDMPICYIVPGKPRMNRKLTGNNSIWSKATDMGEDLFALLDQSISLFNIWNFNDLRFISFKQDFPTYYKYLQAVLTYLHAAMDIPGTFNLGDWYNNLKGNYGLAFYLDKNTSISDSASNDYGASSLANEANQKAGQIREYKQFLGMGASGGLLSKIASGVTEIITGMIESVPVIGGLVGSFGKTLQGSQLYYPDIWQNSSFSRSYTLSFKFYSPYGDPRCIFKYLYVPSMALMCLSLPPMDGIYAYKQPFLVRLSCPGHFEVECGAIESFDMKRAQDFLWTAEGLPSEIEISMSVKDLYPNLIIPKKVKEFKYNAGLTSFIECMAGIRFDQLNFWSRAKRKLKTVGSRVDQVLSFNWLSNKVESTGYNMGQTVLNNFLR